MVQHKRNIPPAKRYDTLQCDKAQDKQEIEKQQDKCGNRKNGIRAAAHQPRIQGHNPHGRRQYLRNIYGNPCKLPQRLSIRSILTGFPVACIFRAISDSSPPPENRRSFRSAPCRRIKQETPVERICREEGYLLRQLNNCASGEPASTGKAENEQPVFHIKTKTVSNNSFSHVENAAFSHSPRQ